MLPPPGGADPPPTRRAKPAAAMALAGAAATALTPLGPGPPVAWALPARVACYVLAAAALWRLLVVRTGGVRAELALDGAVVGAAVGTLLLVGWYLPLVAHTAAPTPVRVVYPLADLTLAVLVSATLLQPGGLDDAFGRRLTSGVLVALGADMARVTVLAPDGHDPATARAVTVAGLLLVFASMFAARAATPPVRLARGPEISVPATAVLVVSAVLIVAAARSVTPGVVVFAALSLLAFSARTALTFRDVAELAETRRQATSDDLTGLANRRLLLQQLHRVTVDGTGNAALVLIDLDRFKEVNDALGHGVGDLLLQKVGPRLAQALRHTDLLARLGGDEFGVLLPDADRASATAAAQRLTEALAEPITLDGVTLHVQASMGIALHPEHGPTPGELLRHADVAMYDAKRRRCGVVVYSTGSDPDYRNRLRLAHELRQAFGTGQLVCHYQPKCALDPPRVVGVEALVRWQHPQLGLLVPAAFLPLAEQVGLMDQLLREVLSIALRQCREWRDAGLDISVAVNASTSNLLDATLPEQVTALLAEHGVPAEALIVEITEEDLMTDPVRARRTVLGLRRRGVRVSVDDYGTGYSALAYVSSLPLSELKLDRRFVSRMADSERDSAIVRSTIDLAHALGLTIVAEGAETAEQWRTLTRLGCDYAQGFYLSRPVPGPDVPAALALWSRRAEDASTAGAASPRGSGAGRRAG